MKKHSYFFSQGRRSGKTYQVIEERFATMNIDFNNVLDYLKKNAHLTMRQWIDARYGKHPPSEKDSRAKNNIETLTGWIGSISVEDRLIFFNAIHQGYCNHCAVKIAHCRCECSSVLNSHYGKK